jgi:NAD+ synthase (glutamine-hydrolysing)
MRLVKVGLGSINTTVGSVQQNTAKVVAMAHEMAAAQVTVACFSEQVLGGYSQEDLVQWRGFVSAQWRALERVAKETAALSTVILVGVSVAHKGHLYNCAAAILRGKILGIVPKEKLPTYNVFYELRTLSPGVPYQSAEVEGVPFGDLIFEFEFGTLALEVCEDIWSPDGPMRRRCYAGAELVVNLSASPFRTGVLGTRREMLATRSGDNQCTLVYANLVGANDGLIFDGGGFVFSNGRPLLECKRFVQGWESVCVDLDRTTRLRTESTTWRLDSLAFSQANGAKQVQTIKVTQPCTDRSGLAYPIPSNKSFFLPSASTRRTAREDFCEDLLDALSMGIGDYFEKTRAFKGIGIALSGGRDSLLTLLIAHRYLERKYAALSEPERRAKMHETFHAFYMPSRYSSDQTQSAAAKICAELGLRFEIVAIDEAFTREEEVTRTMLGGAEPTPITKQNIQARLRGQRMWNWSNTSNFLFLQTGNMSEKAMGYTTIGGDLEGALAILANVPKTVVIFLLEYLLETRGYEGIRACFEAPAGPELAANQKGEDELMPFRALDATFHLYAAEKMSPDEIVKVLDTMFPEDPPGAHTAWVTKFLRLFTQSIYKWVQSPLSLHVGNLDLERERALQLPVVESTEWTQS